MTMTHQDWARYQAQGEAAKEKAQRAVLPAVCIRAGVWAIALTVLAAFPAPFERVVLTLAMLILSKQHAAYTISTTSHGTMLFHILCYLRRVRPSRGGDGADDIEDGATALRAGADVSADDTGRPYSDRWLARELEGTEFEVLRGQLTGGVTTIMTQVERVALAAVVAYSSLRALGSL